MLNPTSEQFISKWKSRGTNLPDIDWTPSRLYWELIYKDVSGWDKVEMAEDLLSLNISGHSSAIADAQTTVVSTR